MKTVKPNQQPASERSAGSSGWIAPLITVITMILIGALVLILRDSLLSDLTNIQLFILFSFFVIGQIGTILIFYIYRKKNQKSKQAVPQPATDLHKEVK